MNKLSNLEINILKLFKGDLPLYKSYWIYYFLGNFLVSAPLMLIPIFQIQKFFYTKSILLLIYLFYYFISCVGVWKSSQRYKGNKFLASLARFVIIIGVASTILLEARAIAISIYGN